MGVPEALRWLPVLAALVAAAACGDNGREQTLSLAQAQAAATDQIREAAAAVFPVGYTLHENPVQPMNCADSANRPTGQVLLGISFWIGEVAGAPATTYFDALRRWWSSRGWTPGTDGRPRDLIMNATRGGYLMSLQVTLDDRIALGNTTPCVWRDGTPA